VLFLGSAYAAYRWTEICHEATASMANCSRLKVHQPQKSGSESGGGLPADNWALVVIFAARRFLLINFCHTQIFPCLGIPSTVVALLLNPIATSSPRP